MNGKSNLFKEQDEQDSDSQSTAPPTPVRTKTDPLNKVYKSILLTSGPIISMSVLVSKGKFKRVTIENHSGAAAAKKIIEIFAAKGLGQLLQYRRANNTSVSAYKIVML